MGTAIGASLLDLVTIEPLAETAIAEGVAALGRIRLIHWPNADSTCYEVP